MNSLLERLRIRRLASSFTILATLSAGILIGSVVAHGVKGQEKTVDTRDATPLRVPSPRDLSTDFTRIVKQVGPAVVNINTETLPKEQHSQRRNPHMRQMPQPQDPNGDDDDQGGGDQGGQGGAPGGDQGGLQDFFNRFFGGQGGGDQGQDEQGREALGSGFIVDSKGYILTNNHVVDKADRIYVKLASDPDNSNGHQATVVGVDKATDVAVIKINVDQPLPTVKLGNSDSSQVGDWVIAIGSPLGLSKTVTAGIVSAKNRTIEPGQTGQFQHFIQTDAAINPGNSGGPLLNMAGEVIGINTAIFTQSNGNQGIGFAMPSNTVISVYNDLIGPEHKVVRGSIGILFQPNVSSAVERVYGAKNGVIIRSVTPGQPADKAGLKSGDVIVSINGRTIKDGDDLVNDISARKPGTTVTIGYLRQGKQLSTTVTIGDRSKTTAAIAGQGQDNNPETPGPEASETKTGLSVADLPGNAPAGVHGVIIQSIKPGSFADEIGLTGLQGGVIDSVNREPIHNKQEFNAAIAKLKSGSDVVFEVLDPRDPKSGGTLLGGTLP
jgi:serine protease Do